MRKRASLYSSSSRAWADQRSRPGISPNPLSAENQVNTPSVLPEETARPSPLKKLYQRHPRMAWLAGGALSISLLVWAQTAVTPTARSLTQQDIDAAVLHALNTQSVPSAAARAYEVIRPSVVRVRGLDTDPDGDDEYEKNIGTGVVIVDQGIILTNLHVIAGARLVKVRFAEGLETEANVIAVQVENDLAVLQARTIPDDLPAATLRSSADLSLGDLVVAVGFPFSIGPSVSAGVVSGLEREYRSPEGERMLSHLIQFDAAVNPGSSGGPLVTAEGEVVGVVTALLNPTDQRVFIGIGFAVPIESAATAIGLPPF